VEVSKLAQEFGRQFIRDAYEEGLGEIVAVGLYIESILPEDIIARRVEHANTEEQHVAA
jgi:hypothetical protein